MHVAKGKTPDPFFTPFCPPLKPNHLSKFDSGVAFRFFGLKMVPQLLYNDREGGKLVEPRKQRKLGKVMGQKLALFLLGRLGSPTFINRKKSNLGLTFLAVF